eukprot:4986680-Prymnesium_polylepis.1
MNVSGSELGSNGGSCSALVRSSDNALSAAALVSCARSSACAAARTSSGPSPEVPMAWKRCGGSRRTSSTER